MKLLNYTFQIFVFIVVCPISVIVCQKGSHFVPRGEKEHVHDEEPPCMVCPRNGRCVPTIQCPARIRPSSHNPTCHLQGTDALGVCCFTGERHAAESDHKYRASTHVSAGDVKAAHYKSKKKLETLMKQEDKLLENMHKTVVNHSNPSFGHHLSMLTYDEQADVLGRGGLLNLFAAQELKSRQAITEDELSLSLTEHTDGPFCPAPPACVNDPSRYRTFGGECNNLRNPSWGAVHTGYERILPPDYTDGIWSLRSSVTGLPLASPRTISSSLLFDTHHPSDTHNLMFMQFGQFIAHDTTAGVSFKIGNGSAISCCADDGTFLPPELTHWACAPVAADPGDPFYGQFGQRCHNFVRTQVAPSSDCSLGYAKQMNGVTHLLDLSHIYGTTKEKVAKLSAPGGLLNTFNDYGRELPPLSEKKECLTDKDGSACFDSGDSHGNQVISLTVLHTIFTREHNRIARALARLNSDWDEEKVYMESRRIVQAEYQHVIYNEWLPWLLGPQLTQVFDLAPSPGYAVSYDPSVNPSLTAEFSTAAFRFGHSIVDGKIIIPSAHRGDIHETISLPEVMFHPSRLRLRPFLDRLLTGLTWQPMQNVDPFVTEALTRYLFHGGNPFGLDLASINIQRGRDYGLRTYNHYRKLIGLQPFSDFMQFPPSAAQRLSSVYTSPDDIDLWIGGLMEEPIEGGVVGVTFANILADQFSKLKRGDRYFYENIPDVNPGAFTPSQLSEIKKVSLSRIICDNRDGIELFSLPPNAFLRADLPGNSPVPCESLQIPSMDLSRFKDL